MEGFVASIKKKYQERRVHRDKQWPPCRSNKLIRLELVERKRGESYQASNVQSGGENRRKFNGENVKRTPLTYGDLFKGESETRPVRKVLVEGDAGIGKTTLSISVSEGWANGRLFQQFELVLLLPLRHKELASVDSIPELLNLLHSSKELCSSVANLLEEKEGDKVLIIADGWDELAESKRSEDSFLYKLVLGEVLPFVSSIVTSRPLASAPLHQLPCIDRFVEVCGFDKESIVEYIQSEFTNDKERIDHLLEQLESNPVVASVCSIPLNCAIVCHLWRWRTLDKALPATMTELYTKLILNVALHNLQKKDEFKNIESLYDFDSLPICLQESWNNLCKFAFQAMKGDKIIFSKEDLSFVFPQGLDKVHSFGLLQADDHILETGHETSFHFLHLTFQEYLAALHLAKLSLDEQLEAFQSLHTEKSILSAMVCRFFFGIYFKSSTSPNFIEVVKCLTNKSPLSIGFETLLPCHCAFEAQKEVITKHVVSSLGGFGACIIIDDLHTLPLTDHPRTAHDCAAVLYMMSYMQEGSVVITFSDCGVTEKQIKLLTDILASRVKMLQVTQLNLSGNKLTNDCVIDLFIRAPAAFSSLSELDLGSNAIGDQSIKYITRGLEKCKCDKLVKLDLCHNSLKLSSLETLACTGLLANVKWLFLEGAFTSHPDVGPEQVANFLNALLNHCHCLKMLDISQNNFKVNESGASTLGKIMSHCKVVLMGLCSHSTIVDIHHPVSVDRLQITLNTTGLGDKGLKAFIESLDNESQFSRLELQDIGITTKGLSSLVDSVCLGKIIIQGQAFPENYVDEDGFPDPDLLIEEQMENVEFHLDYNPLGLEGARKISKMLASGYCQVKLLSLEGCELTTDLSTSSLNGTDGNAFDCAATCKDLGEFLCQMPTYTTITHLYLDYNGFTKERVQILAGFISLCPMLTVLSTCFCAITSVDLSQLLDQLVQLKSSTQNLFNALIMWHLSNNEIDDIGLSILIEHLQGLLFPYSIWPLGFYLQNNKVSTDMMIKLEKELKYRQMRSLHEHYYEVVTTAANQVSLPLTPLPAPVAPAIPELQLVVSPLPVSRTGRVKAMDQSPCNKLLDKVIDFEHNGVSKHLGQIADTMCEWEGPIAEKLDLTRADIAEIKTKYPSALKLQTREALEKWKQKLGSSATYKNLIGVFECAGYQNYADAVRSILDKPLIFQSTSEEVGDSQTLSLECATSDGTLLVDDINLRSTLQEEGSVTKVLRKMEDPLSECFVHQGAESGRITQLASYSEAEKIPFLFHKLLEINNNGLVYTIEDHDITVRFPDGTVAVGETLQFEIGVVMYGPFKFVDDVRPISPILWICPLDQAIKLHKPFQLVLPHFLPGERVQDHQIAFAKANHRNSEENHYTFCVCDTKPMFATTGSKSYGILETNHCCFYCLEARKTPQITRDTGYILVRLESFLKQEVQFCAIYPLNTCFKSLNEQYPPEEGYQVSRCYDFKFENKGVNCDNYIKVMAQTEHCHNCKVVVDPLEAKIKELDIDFWNTEFEILHFKHQAKMYPPSVRVTVDAPSVEPRMKLLVSFEGCSMVSQLHMEILFPLSRLLTDHGGCTYQSDVTTVRSNTIVTDYNGLVDVEHQYLDQLKWWRREHRDVKHLKLYSKISHKWELIATRLGFEPGNIDSIRRNHQDDRDRVSAVLRQWFDNAKNLPNARKYPKSWQGLINLLEDAELGEVATELHAALSSSQSSVRGNLS